MADIIYVLTNEAMPGLVKIGLTNESVESRVTHLSGHTGVPLPFECYFAAEVDDAAKAENILLQLFSEYRVNPRREFFKLEPEKVVLALRLGSFKEITPGQPDLDEDQKEALARVKARRTNLRLEAVDIKPGDILHFSRDESITATVAEGNKVRFEDEIMSLSAAAVKVLHQMGYTTPAASGTWYWMFDGELLDERRRRIEEEQFGQTGDAA